MSNQGYRLSKQSWNNYHGVMFDYGSDMLTLCPSKAIIPWLRQEKTSINPNAVPNRILGMSFQNKPSISHNHLWNFCGQGALTSGISNYTTLKRWLICASIDDEYRSSRNIAISLLRRYRSVVDRGGGDNLKEFINAGVNAYALGCTDESLRKELLIMKESGVGIEENYGGKTSLKSRILLEEVDECILWLGIIFITILCTPQPTIMRWSSSPPVSPETLSKWKGFCALIANAYYMKGMAWLPVKTLQLEQMAVFGKAEERSVVASRMRLVFSTLEVVSPQWPRV